MNVEPTMEGGLRVSAETSEDWLFLRAIVHDADGELDLAERLGEGVCEDAEAAGRIADWQEFVVPDLREEFLGQVAIVREAIEKEWKSKTGQRGSIRIRPEDADAWYGTLNQARLQLHERFSFADEESPPPKTQPVALRAAWERTQFYLALQSVLLEHVMTGGAH